MSAVVYLVGAGPGDPGLLTVRGRELIEAADVIVYDYLANDELLGLARPDARLVNVGKKGFEKHLTQDQISALLVELACGDSDSGSSGLDNNQNINSLSEELVEESAGQELNHNASYLIEANFEDSKEDQNKIIVRLKGGDPFVFGRGGEEALALKEAGIAFEIVSGVTSAVAAAACAGIPVTHRKVSSSVTLVTGHEDPTRTASGVDWSALAGLVCAGGTLCFYMGVRNISAICTSLMDRGAPASAPLAAVRWGTLPAQETMLSTLGGAVADAQACGLAAPAIIVVGDVVALREELAWFEKRPLASRRVLVTRSRSQASKLSSRLRVLGAEVFEVPTIEFAEPDSFEALDAGLHGLPAYDWVVFTSVNGVEGFFRRLQALDGLDAPRDARRLARARVSAIGPATAESLRNHGIEPDCIPDLYRAEAVFEAMAAQTPLAGKRVLLARAQVARQTLVELLEGAGAAVDVAAVYKTVQPQGESAHRLVSLLEEGVDAVTFTSSSTVDNLVAMLGADAASALKSSALCAIGPITAQTLASHGLHACVQAREYTIEGLVEAMVCHFAGPAAGAHEGIERREAR